MPSEFRCSYSQRVQATLFFFVHNCLGHIPRSFVLKFLFRPGLSRENDRPPGCATCVAAPVSVMVCPSSAPPVCSPPCHVKLILTTVKSEELSTRAPNSKVWEGYKERCTYTQWVGRGCLAPCTLLTNRHNLVTIDGWPPCRVHWPAKSMVPNKWWR